MTRKEVLFEIRLKANESDLLEFIAYDVAAAQEESKAAKIREKQQPIIEKYVKP